MAEGCSNPSEHGDGSTPNHCAAAGHQVPSLVMAHLSGGGGDNEHEPMLNRTSLSTMQCNGEAGTPARSLGVTNITFQIPENAFYSGARFDSIEWEDLWLMFH
jgi:hypothetical protein